MSLAVEGTQAEIVAWTCFVVGIALLVGGVVIGLLTSPRRAPRTAEDARNKLDDAKAKLEEARGHIERTASAVAGSGFESVGGAVPEATEAVVAAGASTEAASSALEQVQGIVAALPENLRFAGLLILVGAVLMGVATVQFGDVSLF